MNLAFPLCREPRHEDRVRRLLAGCVAFLTGRLTADDVAAIVLTGSFARGEGTVLAVGHRLRVLGDVEFFVVLRDTADARARRRDLVDWSREASATLGGGDVRVDIEFGPITLRALRHRVRPTIFAYDLRHHGKVLWGDPDILDALPPFPPEAIPREDALFLVFNRIVEQLEAFDRLPALDGEALLGVAYQRQKLVLDLAGSALAFAGRHASSYPGRPAAFARLAAETPSLAALLPASFDAELQEAAAAKIDPGAHPPLPALDGTAAAARAWLAADILRGVPAASAFLRWELEQLLDRTAGLPELLEDWARTPALARRLRDWAKVALHPLPSPRPLGPLRAARLFFTGTPRSLLYVAAAHAYFTLAAPATDVDDVARWLPIARAARPEDPAQARRAVVALWRWCVRNN